MTKDAVPVYAVVRIDIHQPSDDEGDQANAGEGLSFYVTVKEVLPTLDDARAEVKRLNGLKEGRGVRYIWQYSRYFPDGRVTGQGDA